MNPRSPAVAVAFNSGWNSVRSALSVERPAPHRPVLLVFQRRGGGAETAAGAASAPLKNQKEESIEGAGL